MRSGGIIAQFCHNENPSYLAASFKFRCAWTCLKLMISIYTLPPDLLILIIKWLCLDELAVLQKALPFLAPLIQDEAVHQISSILTDGVAIAEWYVDCEQITTEWCITDYRKTFRCLQRYVCRFEPTDNDTELKLVGLGRNDAAVRLDHTCEHGTSPPAILAMTVTWQVKGEDALRFSYNYPGDLFLDPIHDSQWHPFETVSQSFGGFEVLSPTSQKYSMTLPREWFGWLKDEVLVTIQFESYDIKGSCHIWDCRCPMPNCTARKTWRFNLKWTLKNDPPRAMQLLRLSRQRECERVDSIAP
jgi:hypothetical protein